MTSIEMIKILSKPWASVTDIKKIGACGRDTATTIRELITTDIYKTGKRLPIGREKLVPMQNVIDYFNLDIDYIYSMAEKESKLVSEG